MFTRDAMAVDAERLALADAADASFVMTEEAFRAFYDRTARSVWGYLMRLTRDASQADDLLQETYYRFLRANSEHQNEAHRRNALFTIATNLARDAHRRRRVLPFFLAGDAAERAPGPDESGQFERRTDVTRALDALRPRDRAMLWLAYAEGSSHEEIAGALGLKKSSVKLLLYRARRRLAGLLGHQPVKGGA